MKLLHYGTRGSEQLDLLHQGITGRELRAVVGICVVGRNQLGYPNVSRFSSLVNARTHHSRVGDLVLQNEGKPQLKHPPLLDKKGGMLSLVRCSWASRPRLVTSATWLRQPPQW